MIDIIIPAYNSNSYIENAICSIIMQTMKDFIHVYIVNDGGESDYHKIIHKYSEVIPIKEIKLDVNRGPAVARQMGIENSNSEYIVFMDSDDIFNSCYSIESLYHAIKDYKANVVSSYFTEETDNKSINHYDNMIWLHGKIYRRSFLEENKIAFNETRVNEDTGFNQLIYFLTDVLYIQDFTYTWKNNFKSITRSTQYNFYGLEGYIYNICWAVDEAIKRNGNKTKISEILYNALIEIYCRYITFREEDKRELLLKWAKELKEHYLKYCDCLKNTDKQNIVIANMQQLIHSIGVERFLNNSITFHEFFQLI